MDYQGTLTISLNKQDQNLVVTIADGHGIPEAIRDKILMYSLRPNLLVKVVDLA